MSNDVFESRLGVIDYCVTPHSPTAQQEYNARTEQECMEPATRDGRLIMDLSEDGRRTRIPCYSIPG